jgi:hypothetical protein
MLRAFGGAALIWINAIHPRLMDAVRRNMTGMPIPRLAGIDWLPTFFAEIL